MSANSTNAIHKKISLIFFLQQADLYRIAREVIIYQCTWVRYFITSQQ